VIVRFATFNAALTRAVARGLIGDLSTPDDPQARAVAEIVQRTRPDVLLVNELDFDAAGVAVRLFQDNYLSVGQGGADPIVYPHRVAVPSNTGVVSGFDLDRNGVIATRADLGTAAYANDSWGFGRFPGQFAFAVYSMLPILEDRIRTFQHFLWKDMPGALLPVEPSTGELFFSPEVLEQLPLSSKNHADIPIAVGSPMVHFLVSHPTPPVFAGPEGRNRRRNHDEIRFWADYVHPRHGRYVYDDTGRRGGLGPGALFVVAGDLNADPFDGASVPGAAQLLLGHPLVNAEVTPASRGGADRASAQGKLWFRSDPAHHTADFAEPAGIMRVDYVLPSRDLEVHDAAVFWPGDDDPLVRLTGPGFPVVSSDHRLVWVDVSHPDFPPG
jgi:3-phytase